MLRLTDVSIVDIENEKISIDKEILKKYSDYTQNYYSKADDIRRIWDLNNSSFTDAYSHWTLLSSMGCMPIILRTYDTYIEGMNHDMQVYTFPNYDDANSITADISLYAAVMQNTDNPQQAYLFVKSLMDAGMGTFTKDIPVSKGGAKQFLDDLSNFAGKEFSLGQDSVQVKTLTPELRLECETILNSITGGSIRNYSLETIITENMEPYILGEADFDSCYTKFKNQVEIYLYE